jgi:hypothetical protein
MMSTRALQIECLLTPLIDYRTGSLCSAYTAYFYAAGTSTAKNVWTEKEKTNPYTSRTIGSDGTVQVYGDGVYKIVIKDGDGTTVYEWDNIKVQYPNIAVLSKSGTYTSTDDDDYIIVGATMTLNLHAASTWTHPICAYLNGSYTLTIDPNGSELIGGASTYTLSTSGAAVWLFSNGSAIFVANAVSVSATNAINLVSSIGGDAKLTAKTSTIDIEDNNEYLRQKNAADTDYINMIKINASDQIEVGAVLKALEILNTGLTIQDTGGDNTLTLKCNEDLSASRVLSLVVSDSNRALTFSRDFSTETPTFPLQRLIDNSGAGSYYGQIKIASTFAAARDIQIKGADGNFVLLTGDVGTVMTFGQNSAPSGWTRLTTGDTIYDAAVDNAMFCFAKTGNIAQGGAANPQSQHLHAIGTKGAFQWYNKADSEGGKSYNSSGALQELSPGTITGYVIETPNGSGGAINLDCYTNKIDLGNTENNSAPYYIEMILAKKD